MFFLCAFIAPFMLVSCPKPNNPKPEPVNPVARELVGIEVFQPGPTRFASGTDFMLDGLAINLVYNDGTKDTKKVEDDLSLWEVISGFDATSPAGNYDVTVKYIAHTPVFETTYQVSVVEVETSSIVSITVLDGYRKIYTQTVDTAFDYTGLFAELELSSGEKIISKVTEDKWHLTDFDLNTIGVQDVKIYYCPEVAVADRPTTDFSSYQYGTFQVEVKAVIVSASVVTFPKQEYIIGEPFDISNLEVKLVRSDSTEEIYTSDSAKDGTSPYIVTDFNDSGLWTFSQFNNGNGQENLEITVQYVAEKKADDTFVSASYLVDVFNIKGLTIDNTSSGSPFVVEGSTVFFLGEDTGLILQALGTAEVELSLIAADPDGEGNFPTGPKTSSKTIELKDCTLSIPDGVMDSVGAKTIKVKKVVPGASFVPEDSFSISVKELYKFCETPELVEDSYVSLAGFGQGETLLKITETEDTGAINRAHFVYFGDYPQSKAPSAVLFDGDNGRLDRGFTHGAFTMYPDVNGDLFVKNTKGIYKVEKIVWRVLENDYNGTKNALLHSDIVLDIEIFANSPHRTPENTIPMMEVAEGSVPVNNYKYSILRAFLNGENSTDKNGEKYENAGFLQSAFTANVAKTVIQPVNVRNNYQSARSIFMELALVPGTAKNANGDDFPPGKTWLQTRLDDQTDAETAWANLGSHNYVSDVILACIGETDDKYTNDKVFVLSFEELTNESRYGFLKETYKEGSNGIWKDYTEDLNQDTYRKRRATDYAKDKAKNSTFIGGGGSAGYYWMRSPSWYFNEKGYPAAEVACVTALGSPIENQGNWQFAAIQQPNNENRGIVPAICIPVDSVPKLPAVAP